jgi:Bifunctional DNA primase/polymerase, N-terminal/Primase C terminal 1 (PriCT-1)
MTPEQEQLINEHNQDLLARLQGLQAPGPKPGLFRQIAEPLIARGIPVIPLRPTTKIALQKNWPELASTDPAVIAQWDQQDPNFNGACVAFAKPDGVWFLELDKPGFKDVIEAETGKKIPDTFVVRSSPGRGHFYFKHTAASIAMGNRQGKDKDGKEAWSARADNRYVVAPGSYHPASGRRYECLRDAPIVPAPDWLVQWCINAATEIAPVTAPSQPSETEVVLEGNRNNRLTSYAGELRQKMKMDETEMLAHMRLWNETHCSPPLPDEEVRATAHSIGKKPIKVYGELQFDATVEEKITPINLEVAQNEFLPLRTLSCSRLQDAFDDWFQGSANKGSQWPLELALPALVTAASVVVPRPNDLTFGNRQMTNLYTALIGDYGTGKTEIARWAMQAVGIYNFGELGHYYYPVKTGSAEQLLKSLAKKQQPKSGKKQFVNNSVLLDPDEYSHLFGKINIPDSSFAPTLTSAYYKQHQSFTLGGAGGGTEYNFDLAVSMIGGIVESEFGEVFGASSLGGLYDRFLFGRVPPGYRWSFIPSPIPVGNHFASWNLRPVAVNDSVYEVTRQWTKDIPGLNLTRIPEIVTRIAIIYGCLDNKPEITGNDLDHLKGLVEYQMALRGMFKPNPGENPDAIYANRAQEWIDKHADQWTSIRNLKQDLRRLEQQLGPGVAMRSLIGLAASGLISLWQVKDGRALPSDYTGVVPRIGLVRRVR